MIDKPWFLRSAALFLAIILFVFVQTGKDDENGKTVGDTLDTIRDIPVTVYYDNENLVVTGIPETVNMVIEGPVNFVQTTKLLKDFTLLVDLRSLPMGKHRVEIQHENISDKLNVRLDPSFVEVVIEEKITQEFRVDPEMNERLLAEDFILESLEVKPKTIQVTGAKSVVDAISFVKASVSGDPGLNKSFEQQARVRVLDKDLNKLNVTIVPEQVNVSAEIAEYSKEVPIVLKKRGIPSTGVQINDISTNDKLVRVSGSRLILDQMEKLVVDVDISKVDGSEVLEVNLKKPKGISSMSLEKIRVKVDATSTETDKEVSVPEEDPPTETEKVITKDFDTIKVTVRGLDEKYKSSFVQPANGFVSLTAKAGEQLMKTLDKADFIVYIDASGITEEGEQTLPFTVEGPSGVEWKLSIGEITMHIELA